MRGEKRRTQGVEDLIKNDPHIHEHDTQSENRRGSMHVIDVLVTGGRVEATSIIAMVLIWLFIILNLAARGFVDHTPLSCTTEHGVQP